MTSALTGPFITEDGLRCQKIGSVCKHLHIYDYQFPYCDAQPDTAPWLRPGSGTFLYSTKPNKSCPYLVTYDVSLELGAIDDYGETR